MNENEPFSFRHVIWDWNGTLLDDTWLCIEAINAILQPRGMRLVTEEAYRRLFDFPAILYYQRLGFDLEKEAFEDLSGEFMGHYERRRLECRLQPGARETLAAFRRAGISQSVLSAYRQDRLGELVGHFGLGDFFIKINGLDDIYAGGKTELGLRWMEELPYRAEEVLLIGDTVHDYEVARAMGAGCLLVANGYHPRGKLTGLGALVRDSLRGLERLTMTSGEEKRVKTRDN